MFRSKKHGRKKHIKEIIGHAVFTLHADDDILSTVQKDGLKKLLNEAKAVNPADAAADAFINSAGDKYRKLIPPRRFSTLREYLDIIAVAAAVAFGIRGIFLQPFKIPTSSMQPTLFGVHFIAADSCRYIEKTPFFFRYPLYSVRKAELIVKEEGSYDAESLHSDQQSMFFADTVFKIGNIWYTLPGDPINVMRYSGLSTGFRYQREQALCNGWLSLGDHLFVDRFSHHLFGLRRGDVVVFNTEDIIVGGERLSESAFYYIKRLCGMPGDTLKIQNNMLYVRPQGAAEFKPITEFSEKFEKIYSGKGGYHGHVNLPQSRAPLYLGTDGDTFTVPKDSYFMLGDNSFFSYDSRFWGVVPRRNIVGKAMLVFWPVSKRWGMADTGDPVPVNSGLPAPDGFYPMRLQ